jgi:hypothetical protein
VLAAAGRLKASARPANRRSCPTQSCPFAGFDVGRLVGSVSDRRGFPTHCRKALTTWQDAAAVKQLKHLATEPGVTQQALIAEGINAVLAKYGKPTVAT